jgi:predicted transposase YbfD/YdcC
VLITGDAMFAQRSLCGYIVQQGGHYLLEVKDNQSALLLALQRSFRNGPGRGGRTDD